MSVRAVCPECGTTAEIDEYTSAKSVDCRKCGKNFPTPTAKPSNPPPLPPKPVAASGFEVLDEEEVEEPSRPSVGDRPPVGRSRDGDDDDRPRVRSARFASDDDDRPRSRRSRDDDDEDNDRPRSRPSRDDDDEDDDRPRSHASRDDDDEDDDRPRSRASRDDDDEDDDQPRSKRNDDEEDDELTDIEEVTEEDEDDEEKDAPRRRLPAKNREETDDEEEVETREQREDRDDDEDDDEDEHSIPRRRPGDWDDERASKGGSKGMLVLLLLGFLLLAGGGGFAAYMFLLDQDEDPKLVADNDNDPDDPKIPDPKIPDPKINDPKIPDPKIPDPKINDPKIPDPKVPNPKPPTAKTVSFKPVVFDGTTKTVVLPGKVTDSCAGGDGQFIFLHCDHEKKLVVVDVPEAKIVKEIPTTGAETRFTANAKTLLVADNQGRTIQRYTLPSLEAEKLGRFPFPGSVQSLSSGSGSDSPVLVVGTMPLNAWPIHFVDASTLGLADVGWSTTLPVDLPRNIHFRASADGSRWAGVPIGQNSLGTVLIAREGKKLTAEKIGADREFGFASLSTDGNWLFSQSGAALVQSLGSGKVASKSSLHLPAVSGPFEILLEPTPGNAETVKVTAVRRNKDQFEAVAENVPAGYRSGDSLSPDQVNYFVPEARALVVLPSTRTSLEFVKLDLLGSGPKSGVVVTSTAPSLFTPGKPFTYQVRALSTGNATFRVTGQSAGAGVRVSGSGLVEWNVPDSVNADQVSITLRANVDNSLTQQIVKLYNSTSAPPKDPEPMSKSPEPKVPTANIATGVKLVQEAPGKLPIVVPEMKEPRIEVPLPGVIRDACVAGGGRYLIFHCPAARKLAIFDVNTLKIVKMITVNTDDVLFAAGMNKLMVIYPDTKDVLRFSLEENFPFEADTTLANLQKPNAAGMGSAVAGPLILGGVPAQNNASKMSLSFLDPITMKEILIEKAEGDFKVTFGAAAKLRVSADGRTLGAWFSQLQPSGLQIARLSGNTITGAYLGESVGHVAPGPDGAKLFTEKGVFVGLAKPEGPRIAVVPASQGVGHVSIDGKTGEKQTVGVWGSDIDKPIVSFDSLPGFDGKRDPFERDNPTLALDRRLYYVPDAKILVVVNPAGNKLFVYRVEAGKK